MILNNSNELESV